MKKFLYPIIAGVMFGFGASMLKNNLADFSLDSILSFGVLMSIIPGIVGIVLFQIALRYEKGSVVTMLTAASTAIFAVIGGMVLGEVLLLNEMIGLLFIILSVIILLFGERK
jgi:drug/metabolite transporter (DMT)-like permease